MLTPKGPAPINTLFGLVGITLGVYGFVTPRTAKPASRTTRI